MLTPERPDTTASENNTSKRVYIYFYHYIIISVSLLPVTDGSGLFLSHQKDEVMKEERLCRMWCEAPVAAEEVRILFCFT